MNDIEKRFAALSFPADLEALAGDIAEALYGRLWSMCGRTLVLGAGRLG